MSLLDPVGGVANLLNNVIDKIFPDPVANTEAKTKLLELQQNGELARLATQEKLLLAQAEINKEATVSQDKFVSRARPYLIWVGGAAFTYAYIGRPLLLAIGVPEVNLPTPDLTMVFKLLFALLGAQLGVM